MVNSALAAAPDQRTEPHAAANPAVLTLSNVEVLYAEVILALKGVSMQVPVRSGLVHVMEGRRVLQHMKGLMHRWNILKANYRLWPFHH